MEFKLQTNEIKPLIVPEENEKEEWHVSICPKYMVSNFGRVKNIITKAGSIIPIRI